MSEAFWRGAVNRRAKNLALMKPFFALEDNKARPNVDLAPYDMHLLCSVLMEAIIAEMGGIMSGAPYPVIHREVAKILTKTKPTIAKSETDSITSYIIDHLTNERGRGYFEATYQIIADDGTIQNLVHPYRLLEQRLSIDDELVYVASAEAIHIYLSGLGLDLEAEQAANDAVLEHYLSRGKHKEAGEAADMARKRSVELRSRLRSWLVTAERSFDEIQYVTNVLPELERMQIHVRDRGKIEQRQIEDIQNRVLQLPPGDQNRNTLVDARKAIENSADEHVRLLAELQQCSTQLLDWQSHHRFRQGESPAIPDPTVDFLEPILKLNGSEFLTLFPRLWPTMVPPRLPVLADIPALMDALLADLRETNDKSELDPIPDSCEEIELPKRFTSETCERADALLEELGTKFLLSDALRAAQARFGNDAPELAYVSVVLPQWFELDPDDGSIARPTGLQIQGITTYFGDDLAITRTDRK